MECFNQRAVRIAVLYIHAISVQYPHLWPGRISGAAIFIHPRDKRMEILDFCNKRVINVSPAQYQSEIFQLAIVIRVGSEVPFAADQPKCFVHHIFPPEVITYKSVGILTCLYRGIGKLQDLEWERKNRLETALHRKLWLIHFFALI